MAYFANRLYIHFESLALFLIKIRARTYQSDCGFIFCWLCSFPVSILVSVLGIIWCAFDSLSSSVHRCSSWAITLGALFGVSFSSSNTLVIGITLGRGGPLDRVVSLAIYLFLYFWCPRNMSHSLIQDWLSI